MGTNIFSALSKKIVTTIITIGSMFYSAISGVNAEFDELQLRARGDRLLLSIRLVNCFSEDLDKIFSSGREVKIHFLVQVVDDAGGELVHESDFYHAVTYSLIDGVFSVYRSEKQQQQDALSLEEAKISLAEIDDYPLISADQLLSGKHYQVKVTAFMDKIRLPDMDEETNLMFYWNSLKPTMTSGSFTKDIFEQ